MIANGYVDLQVNGYAGVDFNQDNVSLEEVQRACDHLANDGVAGILATVVTDSVDVMARRLERLVQHRAAHAAVAKMITGFHIEGPFLSAKEGFRGAHPEDAIVPANVADMDRLLEAANGLTKLVTLAPEHDEDLRVTEMLSANDVLVAAGHCDPTREQLEEAIGAGLTAFTHLGNGCPMQLHRHDNVVQRALSLADRLWLCFIADGVHVPFPALSNYLRLGGDRAIVVTDAMSAAGLGPGKYKLGRWDVEVGGDLAAWAPKRAHLVGSAMTMRQAEENLRVHLGLDADRVCQLTQSAPREFLGADVPERMATA